MFLCYQGRSVALRHDDNYIVVMMILVFSLFAAQRAGLRRRLPARRIHMYTANMTNGQ